MGGSHCHLRISAASEELSSAVIFETLVLDYIRACVSYVPVTALVISTFKIRKQQLCLAAEFGRD